MDKGILVLSFFVSPFCLRLTLSLVHLQALCLQFPAGLPTPSTQNISELFENGESIANPTLRPDMKDAGSQRDTHTCPRVPTVGSGTSAQPQYPARALLPSAFPWGSAALSPWGGLALHHPE